MSIFIILVEAPPWNLSKDETGLALLFGHGCLQGLVVLTKCHQILPSLVKELLRTAALSTDSWAKWK